VCSTKAIIDPCPVPSLWTGRSNDCTFRNITSLLVRSSSAATARKAASFPTFTDALNLAGLENWLEALHITPISATEWQCSENWVLEPRILRDSMFFVFHNGFGWGRVEDRKFDIRSGDMMLIPQGSSHEVEQGAGVAFNLSAVHFHAHVFGGINILDLLGFPVHVRPLGGRDDILLESTRKLNREFATKAPGYLQSAAALLMQIILHVLRYHGSSFTPPYHSEKVNEVRRLLPAFDHIERNLGDGSVRVGDLARKVFVSEVQFRKLFRRVASMSPVRFIQSRRIDRACHLLRESGLSIDQVAQAVGFADASFFCRVFKSWTQATPAQYRQTSKFKI
jgi:AraC-like DNA-binding protein